MHMYFKLPVSVVQYKHKSFPFIYKLNSMIQLAEKVSMYVC